MSKKNRSIFENLKPKQEISSSASAELEPKQSETSATRASQFAAAPRAKTDKPSPFTIVDDRSEAPRDSKMNPIQAAKPEEYAFKAAAAAPASRPSAKSPFATATAVATAPTLQPEARAEQAIVASSTPTSKPAATAASTPTPQEPEPAITQTPEQMSTSTPTITPPTSTPSSSSSSSASDSSEIKQLELRAIFGVDRELTKDEILQRARSLPGIRDVTRLNQSDVSTVDAFKVIIANLGFGSTPFKLSCASVPIEFIREGKSLLIVQTDGGFAPGVKETLMIVARELAK